MKFIKYLTIAKYLILFNLPISVLGTFFDIRDTTTYFILIPFTLLDIYYIFTNYRIIKLNKIELSLIFFIFLSIIIGFKNTFDLNRRYLTDVSNPLLFILKISLFRKIFLNKYNRILFQFFLNKISLSLFKIGFISIFLFFLLSFYKSMYAGLTPTTHPYFILNLIRSNYRNQFLSFLLIIASGKRALLLSSVLIFFLFQVYIKKNGKIFLYSFLFIIILGFFISFLNLDDENGSALEKYKYTYDLIVDNIDKIQVDSDVFNRITAGRASEVVGVLDVMNSSDYLLGRGIGFTYTYYSQTENEDITGYANLHFTPLSLISKYGLIFTLILYAFIFKSLHRFNSNSKYILFFTLFVIGSLIDMLFAYSIFVDPLIPLSIGYLYSKK
jgi:hypothetical protein